MLLNEDVFEDIVELEVPDILADVTEDEIEPEGPAPGMDTGISDLLLSLINDENEAIQGYLTFKASIEGHEDFNEVIDDIITEEYNHIGMLQTLLKDISPNSETIESGKEEASDILYKENNDDFEVSDLYGEIDDSF